MPVNRWIPRRSGALGRTSELQRSCSSPPPTSTAPTSVISHASPPRPLVSVSTATNSIVARGAASNSIPAVIRNGPDGVQTRLQRDPQFEPALGLGDRFRGYHRTRPL